MPTTTLDLVRNPDFDFQDLQLAQQLAAAITPTIAKVTSTPLILGPESSYCPHNGERVYDPRDDEVICLICGDFVSHAQLEAERTAPEPVGELP